MAIQNSLNQTPGTNGQLLIGSTGTTPSFATVTSSDTSIGFTTGAGSLSFQVATATTGQRGGVLLASNAEAIAGTDTGKAITADDLKAKLGTQTAHGVLVGAGTSTAVTALSVGTNGQVLLGSTGADPVFATLTSSDSTISFTTGAGSLSLQATGGGITWTVQTGASQTLAKSTGTFSNRAGSAVAFTLPTTAAVGDTFEVANMGARAAGWTIAYGTGQYIRFGNVTTTTTTGSLAATAFGDAVRLVCSVANTEFVVTPGSIGNITYV